MKFAKRKMTCPMINTADDIYPVLKQSKGILNIEYCNLSEQFNHSAVLLYYTNASSN